MLTHHVPADLHSLTSQVFPAAVLIFGGIVVAVVGLATVSLGVHRIVTVHDYERRKTGFVLGSGLLAVAASVALLIAWFFSATDATLWVLVALCALAFVASTLALAIGRRSI